MCADSQVADSRVKSGPGTFGRGNERGDSGVVLRRDAVDAAVGRIRRFAQGNELEGNAQAAMADGASVEYGKAGVAAQLEALAGQGAADAGDLDGAIGLVEVFQPVGGEVFLAGAEHKGGFNHLPVHSDVAGAAVAGDVVLG